MRLTAVLILACGCTTVRPHTGPPVELAFGDGVLWLARSIPVEHQGGEDIVGGTAWGIFACQMTEHEKPECTLAATEGMIKDAVWPQDPAKFYWRNLQLEIEERPSMLP